MNMDISNGKDLTLSEISWILRPLGYCWSNEAQCYYSTDFEIPLLDGQRGRELASRIYKYYGKPLKGGVKE